MKYCPITRGDVTYIHCLDCGRDQKCRKFFCLVVGSRTFNDYAYMEKTLDNLLKNQMGRVVIVSGGAKGADSLAERYAKERGYDLEVFPADWEKHGNSAGYIRNGEMHEYIAKMEKRGVVAFWDGESKGTANNFELAKKYGNPIRKILFRPQRNAG